MSMLTSFPGFAAYAIATTVLCLNLLVIWNASGGVRAKTKTTPNREDVKTFGDEIRVTEGEAASVARVMRVHRNAVAVVVPFLFVALVYVLLGAPAREAWVLLGAFTAARVVHSVVYALGVQPWRTISYAVSQLAVAAVMVQVVRAVL
jgi:glutathione S-transferase